MKWKSELFSSGEKATTRLGVRRWLTSCLVSGGMPVRVFSMLLLVLALVGAEARADQRGLSLPERFDYRWSLAGFKGALARLFVPGQGEGRLTTARAGDGGESALIQTELLISSSDGQEGEFWLYGAEIDPVERRTVRSWSSQRFRGESREREREAEDVDALDLASSIYYLRQERPDLPTEDVIWSSGRLNAVMVRPGPRGTAVWQGRRVDTRSYSIRGLPKPGQRTWSGKMDLVLTDDERAIPLEIVVVRKGLRIRLELADLVE